MTPRIFCELLEYAEEADLVPAYAVSFSGCNLRCLFCITGTESQDATQGRPADAAALAARIRHAVAAGARSAYFLGGEPTRYLPFLEDVAARLAGLPAPLVLKTNLVCSPAVLDRALDAFDVLVADFKFGNDDCARRLAGCAGYGAVLQRNLRRAAARRRLVVRHLLMPGHVDCCLKPVAAWMRRELPSAEFSLRDHFVPAFRARSCPGLARTTTAAESQAARALLAEVPA